MELTQPVATILAASIATIPGLLAAYLAERSRRAAERSRRAAEALQLQLEVRQARLDERDLIPADGFRIPLGADDLWRDYYGEVDQAVNAGESAEAARRRVSNKLRTRAPIRPDAAVGLPAYPRERVTPGR